ITKSCGKGCAFFFGILLSYFIAKTPHNYGGMIPVSTDKGSDILFMPVWKDQVKIQGCFLSFPNIKYFIHNQKTHSISKIKKFACRRVMCHAYGVASHFA